jgi:hypothetical protein
MAIIAWARVAPVTARTYCARLAYTRLAALQRQHIGRCQHRGDGPIGDVPGGQHPALASTGGYPAMGDGKPMIASGAVGAMLRRVERRIRLGGSARLAVRGHLPLIHRFEKRRLRACRTVQLATS